MTVRGRAGSIPAFGTKDNNLYYKIMFKMIIF